jgi:hypothetical protein
MKKTIAVVCLFVVVLASCQERTATAPAPVPPVTPAPVPVPVYKIPPRQSPYSFFLAVPGGQLWNLLDSTKAANLIDRITEKIKVKGIYTVSFPDRFGRVAVAITDTTPREWSRQSISRRCRLLFGKVNKIVYNQIPGCQRLFFAYASDQYVHKSSSMIVSYDTVHTLIKDTAVRSKLLRLKRGFQGICNRLTKQFKTYDGVTVELYTISGQGANHGLAVFELPLDSTRIKAGAIGSTFSQVIPDVIAGMKAVDPFFKQVKFLYDGDYSKYGLTRDTLFICQ